MIVRSWPFASAISRIAFASDGKTLACTGPMNDTCDKFAVLDLVSGESVARLYPRAGFLTGMAFSPDGRWLRSPGGRTGLRGFRPGSWDVPPVVYRDHSGEALAAAPDGDSPVVARSGGEGGVLAGWRVSTAGLVGPEWSLASGAVGGDGLAPVPGTGLFAALERGSTRAEVTSREFATGAVRGAITCAHKAARQLTASPDGRWAVAWGGATLAAHAVACGLTPRTAVSATRKHFAALAFHPAGRVLAAVANDPTVILYDAESWAIARTHTWDVGRLRCAAFSPDGTLAAAGSDTGQIVLWDQE